MQESDIQHIEARYIRKKASGRPEERDITKGTIGLEHIHYIRALCMGTPVVVVVVVRTVASYIRTNNMNAVQLLICLQVELGVYC